MAVPNGSVQAISSGAITVLAIGVAFLGFWGFGANTGKVAWELKHLLVLLPGAIGFYLLGLVPFIATQEGDESTSLKRARRSYIGGAAFVIAAMFISFSV